MIILLREKGNSKKLPKKKNSFWRKEEFSTKLTGAVASL